MWVEMSGNHSGNESTWVILFVRMWVEIYSVRVTHIQTWSHPLREDVSWNMDAKEDCFLVDGHPLREDVSWNINIILWLHWWHTSSSSWGCELKCQWLLVVWNQTRHPLREDVSWNTIAGYYTMGTAVILFVRMWVEMLLKITLHWEIRSSSSWGCELKCLLTVPIMT